MIDEEEQRGLPVFLERRSYRRRRLHDAARLLPVLGMLGWMVPLLWSIDTSSEHKASSALVYIFSIWIVLIFLSFFVSYRLERNESGGDDDSDEKGSE